MVARIAIIGGGAAGASVLSELLTRPGRSALHVDWYTGSSAPGRGVAYAARSTRQLLNVRAAAMGLFAGTPHGFLDFVQRGQPDIAGTEFLPRSRYGDYLETELAHALQQGRASEHEVDIIPHHADALLPAPDQFTVLQGENRRTVDAAVLALGALPPRALPGVSPRALESGRYMVDPWRLLARTDEAVPAPRHVVVIGLGLTAVDVLLELSARWPATRFTALSRHGQLPAAHRHALISPDGDSATRVAAMHEAPAVRAWLRVLREATAHGEWRGVIDSLRPHVSTLWRVLPPAERARFMRHARSAWERARHRMPPQVAAALDELELSGRLQRERGRVVRVEADADLLTLDVAAAGVTRTLHPDLVIQATGLDTELRHTSHPLLRQLLTDGHVRADPLGLGLLADSDGRLHHAEQPWPNLFALGSLLRGVLWESTAMPEIRLQARVLADRLLAD